MNGGATEQAGGDRQGGRTAAEPSVDALAQALSCLRAGDDLQRYGEDASGLAVGGQPALVFRPGSTQEVASIVQACAREGRRVTVQGGRSGLAGGAVPDDGDVVIAMERMDSVDEFDTVGGTITVQAGMVLEQLCALVEAQGWYFPLDLGARGSCQIGGNVATNAGGNRVLRYGTTRELVLGLEVVMADGTVLSMLNKGLKNNTGLDLKHLFIGSEGSLGIITRVVLRLFPKPARRYSALVALDTFDALAQILKLARAGLPTLSSFEVMWRDYLVAAGKAIGKAPPFDALHPIYILLETEGPDIPQAAAQLEDFLGMLLERALIRDAVVPQTQEQAAQLWRFRDAIGEILREMRPYVAFDVGVPLSSLSGFIDAVNAQLSAHWPGAQRLLFGHLGDGNLHVSTGPHAEADLVAVEDVVYALVQGVGGSISAEHGIGRIKKPFLGYSRSDSERALMRQIKQALDGRDALNRGRIVDIAG